MLELVRNEAGYDEDDYGLPADTAPRGIRCGAHPRGMGIRHENVAAVSACHAIGRDLAAQQAGEIWAEGAIERHLEGWNRLPDPDEERDRMIEAYGYGPPPGF